MKTIKTIEQQRAAHAWDAWQTIATSPSREMRDKAPNAIKSIPSRILTSGLGQTLAFLHAKAGPQSAETHIVDALTQWISKRLPATGDDLLKAVVHGDSLYLRRATEESLAYLQWLKRFAEAGSKDL